MQLAMLQHPSHHPIPSSPPHSPSQRFPPLPTALYTPPPAHISYHRTLFIPTAL